MIPEPNSKAARILVVDDDRAMCQLLVDLLREDGYRVEVSYDGESAIEKHKTSRFDLTITDLMMPKMKGIELIQRLREIDGGAPVLLITAFGTIESAVEAMRAGAFHYVTKPFHNDANNSDVPSILLEVVSVDKDNLMQTVIKDGYAKFDDVYKNVPAAERPKQN